MGKLLEDRILDFLNKRRGKSATITEISNSQPLYSAQERTDVLDDLERRGIVTKEVIMHGGPHGTRFKRTEYKINYDKFFEHG